MPAMTAVDPAASLEITSEEITFGNDEATVNAIVGWLADRTKR
jgi:hypothetical protein